MIRHANCLSDSNFMDSLCEGDRHDFHDVESACQGSVQLIKTNNKISREIRPI